MYFHQYWLLGSNQRIGSSDQRLKLYILHGTVFRGPKAPIWVDPYFKYMGRPVKMRVES